MPRIPCDTEFSKIDLPDDVNLAHNAARNFRFWPIFVMSFLRPLFFSMYSLALPNYLIYQRNIAPSMVGLISSMSSITYIIGPVVGRKLTEMWGIKPVILISATFSFLATLFSILFVVPSVLLVVRAVDGFVNGFFWPNAINLISTWEKRYEKHSSVNFLSRFNNSWNFGLISGYIFGYVFVQYIGTDLSILIISTGISCLMVPSALLLERCNNFAVLNNRAVVLQDFKLRMSNGEVHDASKYMVANGDGGDDEQGPTHGYLLAAVPLFIAYGGIIIYASSKSITKFTLPYFFKAADINSSWVYFIVLFQQVAQIIGLNIIARQQSKKQGYFFGLSALLAITIAILFHPGVYIIAGLIVISGTAVGLMQGTTQRIVMDYTKTHNTTKYSMLNEMVTGISFGIMPTVAGFLLEYNIYYDYLFLGAVLLIVGPILLVISNRYVNTVERNKNT